MQVYLIRMSKYYKIGRSSDAVRRLKRLVSASLPFELSMEIVHAVEHQRAAIFEKKLHQQFADVRVRGEWFKLSPEQVADVKRLMDTEGVACDTAIESVPVMLSDAVKIYSRADAAKILNVSPARISQIADRLNIQINWQDGLGFYYSKDQVKRMLQRNTKPGPKPQAKGKK